MQGETLLPGPEVQNRGQDPVLRPPESVTLGNPVFQELNERSELHDLVGPKSYRLFSILSTDYERLQQKPEEWENSPDFKEMENFVRTVKVTSDVAERGVKVISEG